MSDLPVATTSTSFRPLALWGAWALAWTLLGAALLWLWRQAGGLEEQQAARDASFWSMAAAVMLLGYLALALLGLRRAQRSLTRAVAPAVEARASTVRFRYHLPPSGRGYFSFLEEGAAELLGLDAEQWRRHPDLVWEHNGTTGAPCPGPAEFTIEHVGGLRWIRQEGRLVATQPDGEQVYEGAWQDMTRVRQAQGRFDTLFDRCPTASLLLDAEHNVVACNPAALALFAAESPAQLQGHSPWQRPLSAPGATAGPPPMQGDAALRAQARLDGSRFQARIVTAPLPPQDDGSPLTLVFLEDVTMHQRTEDALRRALEAEQSSQRARSTFLSNMSHEIRTPMNAIIGMTHLALEDPNTDKHRGYVVKAHQAAKSLLQITNDILDLARIESGQLELECVEFSLQGVVDHLADVLGPEAERKGLELLFSAPPDLPTHLLGDPSRLRQVLLHLGSNALKFTDRGSVTVGLDVRGRQGVEVELHGWVRDTGIGISPDQQTALLFESFTQGDASSTRRFGGSGLGLSICRHLLERMGGRLWVDSVPERGSTFHFTLRLHLASGQAPSTQLRDDWSGKRVLLADDNADARTVLGEMLSRLGIQVDTAASGPEALARLREAERPYDWIMLDWKMPHMDGIECAGMMQTQAGTHTPGMHPCILLVTAFNREEALAAAGDVALADVLTKPITPQALAESLRKTFQVRPLKRQAEAPVTQSPPPDLLAGARILLVEDHPLNQELARELLQLAGAEVVSAENGALALTALARHGPFDCVLMDCQMPVMDGYTATRKIRQHPQWQHLPILAMTASALPSDREHALASGMNDHIAKPLDVAQTYRVVSQWVAAGRTVRDQAMADQGEAGDGAPVKTAPDWSSATASR